MKVSHFTFLLLVLVSTSFGRCVLADDNEFTRQADRAPAITTGYDTRGEISTDTQIQELRSEAQVDTPDAL